MKPALDEVYSRVPELQQFRGRRHDEQIRRFQALDREQLILAQQRLQARLSALRPNPYALTARSSELAILQREVEKRRKQMALRRLFREIPNLLLTLKPCLLMSPLSVSQFLEPEIYQFDTVIFDEASQICSEDAIGAIFRGRQVIVVGDREQLPPTNFFAASVGEAAFEDEDDDTDAYESILDECSSALHRKALHWHYRSRHEHLIAFSNARIYRNLITFPSATEGLPDQGVEFTYVPNGVYERSASRANPVEASKVAELVFDHFRRFPARSLGVVTFSEAQQSAIEAEIYRRRRENLLFEPFFGEDKEEAFFVKNLENVQGDERDTIIFSVGYARDRAGILHMNFGPLTRQGGHRRLNVAITRAKLNVKLVSSMKPTDIDLERTSSEGVRMLRDYMEFAIHGPLALQRELRVNAFPEFDSPFEEAVHRELVHLGFQIDTQVGCSGYRIDLSVRDPERKGHYLLGIECDGRTYHSAKTARDRDRLREEVLRGLGWRIHRIWSTDWIKDPKSEVQRLIQAIETAKANRYSWEDVRLAMATPPTVTREASVQQGLNREQAENTSRDGQTASASREAEIPSASWRLEENGERRSALGDFAGETLPASSVGIPECQAASAERAAETLMLPGMTYYEEADISELTHRSGMEDEKYICDLLGFVIEMEGPIHLELLARRVAPFWGRERAGSQVKRLVEAAAIFYAKDRCMQRGEFYWPVGMEQPPARAPAPGEKPRAIGHICVEERAEVLYLVVQQAFGLTVTDLIVESARVLGYNRTGNQIREAMQEALNVLISSRRVDLADGKVRIAR